MTLDLIDIGANLGHDSFDNDRDAVGARAAAAGVTQMVVTGSTVDMSRRAASLAAARPGVLFATAGIHPHHATELDEDALLALTDLLDDPGVVAAGECGLDYFRNFSPPEAQERAFHAQLELAARTNMPVFLHQRDAHQRFVAILREHIDGLERAVAHCFTGNAAELEACLELGLSIGITGWICDERRGSHLRDVVSAIPPDRLMVETDAPYLLPRDLDPKPKSRRNEPMHLAHVVATIAASTGHTPEELGAITSANARRFFGLPKPLSAVTVDESDRA